MTNYLTVPGESPIYDLSTDMPEVIAKCQMAVESKAQANEKVVVSSIHKSM